MPWRAGQASIDGDGSVVPGEMRAQIARSLDNLETVLHEAGMSLETGRGPAATLVQVTGLGFPELRVELAATAIA